MNKLERDALPGAMLDPIIKQYTSIELTARSAGYPVGLTANDIRAVVDAFKLARDALLSYADDAPLPSGTDLNNRLSRAFAELGLMRLFVDPKHGPHLSQARKAIYDALQVLDARPLHECTEADLVNHSALVYGRCRIWHETAYSWSDWAWWRAMCAAHRGPPSDSANWIILCSAGIGGTTSPGDAEITHFRRMPETPDGPQMKPEGQS